MDAELHELKEPNNGTTSLLGGNCGTVVPVEQEHRACEQLSARRERRSFHLHDVITVTSLQELRMFSVVGYWLLKSAGLDICINRTERELC